MQTMALLIGVVGAALLLLEELFQTSMRAGGHLIEDVKAGKGEALERYMARKNAGETFTPQEQEEYGSLWRLRLTYGLNVKLVVPIRVALMRLFFLRPWLAFSPDRDYTVQAYWIRFIAWLSLMLSFVLQLIAVNI
jgi:hypothetical protein